jgi:hypothetical protein
MIQPGTYQATITGTSIYQSDSGAVMIAIALLVGETERLTAHQCLVQKDGTVSDITVRMCKETLGWDGTGELYDYLCAPEPQPAANREVEAVIEQEEYNGKLVTKVRYLNPPGGGSRLKPAMDRAAFIQKASAKIRALTGGVPVKKPTPEAPKAMPPAPKAPTAPETGPTATMEDAWDACCKQNPGNSESAWFDTLKKLGMPENNTQITPHQWAKVKAAFADDLPM